MEYYFEQLIIKKQIMSGNPRAHFWIFVICHNLPFYIGVFSHTCWNPVKLDVA